MSIPLHTLTVRDPGLGIVPQNIDGISAKIGCCSAGTVGQLLAFSNKQAVRDALGYGPLVEAICQHLEAGGGTVYGLKATTATAGAAGAVTQSGTGPVVTVSGAAYDAYRVRAKVVAGGVRGTATFQYSLDYRSTDPTEPSQPLWSQVLATAATYAIPNTGLTLAFAEGTYVADETYTFTCTPPTLDATGLGTALDTLLADSREWRFAHVVAHAASASASASLASTMKTKLESAAVAYRYVRGLLDCADDTDANVISAFSAFESARVMVGAGWLEMQSVTSGPSMRRCVSWAAAPRFSARPVHEDLGRVATGSIPSVTKLYRDEATSQGLDAARCITARTHIGLPGFYFTSGKTMASLISDYQLAQYAFVIDKGCRVQRVALLRYLAETVRVDAASGYIYEVDAQAIERDIQSQLEAVLVATGNAVGVSCQVKRDENILSTQTLRETTSVVPNGYARAISSEIGLVNPAIATV